MLKKYEYQCILTVTINTKDGKLCKQIPVFILPETLGINWEIINEYIRDY